MFEREIPTVILSGGQSRRMDRNDKAFLSISNQTLLEIVVGRLQRQTQQVAINTNSNNPKYTQLGLPILTDEIGGFLGPLAGIFTAMKWANDMGYKKVATVAVDTPLFPKNLLKELYSKMKAGNYDIVFANGVYQIQELRELEKINNSKKKEIYPTGYMYFDYLSKIEKKKHEDFILFAPSWSYSKNNCLDKYGFKILSKLIEQNYKVIFRPHPEHFKRSKIQIEIIKNNFSNNSNFIFDDNFSNIESLQKSKLIITDYSGIAIEAFYPFLKPVLYINTEEKIQNDIFYKIKIDAMEDKIRNKFGVQITPEQFSNLSTHVSRSLSNIEKIKDEIEIFYKDNFANFKKVVDKNYNILKNLN